MKVLNIHKRRIQAAEARVASILDSLSGPQDELWPHESWPPMLLDPGLVNGARGGHGPVRYTVADYVPGRKVTFRFDRKGLAGGLEGTHCFEITANGDSVILSHVLEAGCGLSMWAKWKAVIEPLHDALIEDAFDKVECRMSGEGWVPSGWSPRVKFLRSLLARRRESAQRAGKSTI